VSRLLKVKVVINCGGGKLSMSYDIYLLDHKPSDNIDRIIERVFSEEAEEINPGLPDPQKERQKRQLAAKLIEKNPTLEVFQFGYQEIASINGITEEEAKIKYRHVELNGSDDGNGVQITLYDDSATITVPYWHKEEEAKATFEEIWEYLKIIQGETDYFAYDPQLGEVLNLSDGFSKVLSVYTTTVKQVEAQITNSEGNEKRAWWRFW
jgi:hypothetical protein